MKKIKFIAPLILGLVLALGATGCKHHPTGMTKLPPSGTENAGRTGGEGLPPGGTLPPGGPGMGEKPGTTDGGIPQGPGHQGWIPDAAALQSDTVHFAFDSSVIKPDEKSKVTAVANYLKSNAGSALRVEGHCDERGTEEYNRSLGERRAVALREELVSAGVEASRVDTLSYGKDRPAATSHDEAAWKQNRRGEFIVLTPPK